LILESVVLIAYTFSVWFFASYISTRVEWVWTSEFTYGTLIGLVSWLFMRFASWQRKKIWTCRNLVFLIRDSASGFCESSGILYLCIKVAQQITNDESMSMEKTYAYEVEKIFTSWYSSLCYFAFRYVQDDETARGIVQEVFVRLMEKRQSVQSE